MDTLDLAHLIEVEAFDRYTLFAAQIGSGFSNDAGSVFQSMADNEKKHGDELAERRKKLFGDEPVRVRRDDVFDVEAPDVGAPHRTMSEFKAYQVALQSEKKAFAFYDRALRSVKHPTSGPCSRNCVTRRPNTCAWSKRSSRGCRQESKVDLEDQDDTSMRMGF